VTVTVFEYKLKTHWAIFERTDARLDFRAKEYYEPSE
jgi:hypothetical protein